MFLKTSYKNLLVVLLVFWLHPIDKVNVDLRKDLDRVNVNELRV